jgi:hypothetical protein
MAEASNEELRDLSSDISSLLLSVVMVPGPRAATQEASRRHFVSIMMLKIIFEMAEYHERRESQ